MSKLTKIKIHLDETTENVEDFKLLKEFEINQTELFKYAIWMWEVPSHIKESQFDYLQSKVPALEALLGDHLDFKENSIINLSNDDRVKKIASEAVGVGIGLKYTVELLKSNPNKFKKIPPAINGKYLDYSTINDKKEYEIETKGTVSSYYTNFKNDIIAKKKNSPKEVYLRFGTIAMFQNSKASNDSQCVIVDDPPQNIQVDNDDSFKTQLEAYSSFLSFILDSKYFNKYIKPLSRGSINRIRINDKKFFTKYKIHDKEYFGECFDHRLIKEHLDEELFFSNKSQQDIFKSLTKKLGKVKIFIGLDKEVINAINKKDEAFLFNYSSPIIHEDSNKKKIFLDKDGILIIKSKGGGDEQLERLFSEDEVQRRLGLFSNYIRGQAHKCGAPCTSKDIEGKPCEIMTYREHCHFHR